MDRDIIQTPIYLKVFNALFILFWASIAIFPLLWILIMSFKLPADAFAENFFQVILGFQTLEKVGGFSLVDLIVLITGLYFFIKWHRRYKHRYLDKLKERMYFPLAPLATVLHGLFFLGSLVLVFFYILPGIGQGINSILNHIPWFNYLSKPIVGMTTQHYYAVWIENNFYENFLNSIIITAGVMSISLTIGTLAGYGLARSSSSWAFWLLILALIFRALPHSVLVSGYLPMFIHSREFFSPLWEWETTSWLMKIFSEEAPTLYGHPLPVIIVLVAINQPFTIWMLRSFFSNIPQELDEAARVDGCSYLQAFYRVIMPVMWPGVITAGLFSFLLAYNDYLVTSLLLDYQSQTMVPAITQYFNRETTTTDEIEAVAAAVSIVIPLFFLVMFFQKQIVAGLTQGAVKG